MANLRPLSSNPQPLGKATVASSGTPVPIATRYAADPALNSYAFRAVTVTSFAGNSAGNVYVLSNSSPADTTNYTNVLAVLTKGLSVVIGGPVGTLVPIANIYVDAGTNGDFVFSSVSD